MPNTTVQPSTAAPVSIQGRFVVLRPVDRNDYPDLFAWRSDLTEAHLWTTQARRVVTFEQFVPEMERLLQESIILLVADRDSAAPIGFVRAYNLNLVDGIAFAQGFITTDYRFRPHVAETGLLFSDYLFGQFPLRKLYAEAAGYNEYAHRTYQRLGFRQQARLTEHLWYGDRYWDWHIFSLSREEWIEVRDRVQILMRVQRDAEELVGRDRDAPTTVGAGKEYLR